MLLGGAAKHQTMERVSAGPLMDGVVMDGPRCSQIRHMELMQRWILLTVSTPQFPQALTSSSIKEDYKHGSVRMLCFCMDLNRLTLIGNLIASHTLVLLARNGLKSERKGSQGKLQSWRGFR